MMTMITRLGAVGGIIAISLQLITRLPAIETSQARLEANITTVMRDQISFGSGLIKYMDRSIKIQIGDCLNQAVTREQKQRCNQ